MDRYIQETLYIDLFPYQIKSQHRVSTLVNGVKLGKRRQERKQT